MEVNREKIIAIFEQHMELPGTHYEKDNFLDFLLAKPKKKRAVFDSFRGLRRYNAFINEIQLEFAIYFSLKDRDSNYSLDRFVDRVKELTESPCSSLTSLKNQMRDRHPRDSVVYINMIMLAILLTIFFIFKHNALLLTVMAVIVVAINASFLKYHIKENDYNKQLLKKIIAKAENATQTTAHENK